MNTDSEIKQQQLTEKFEVTRIPLEIQTKPPQLNLCIFLQSNPSSPCDFATRHSDEITTKQSHFETRINVAVQAADVVNNDTWCLYDENR
jgi:hypothetical protein